MTSKKVQNDILAQILQICNGKLLFSLTYYGVLALESNPSPTSPAVGENRTRPL